MQKSLASVIGRFAAELQFSAIPSGAIRIAKVGIADCIAVAFVGHAEDPIALLGNVLGVCDSVGEAGILGSPTGLRTSAQDAAWINGSAGHVLDYDDVARGHPSVTIVPAILAEAEAMNASGTDILTAYVVGYETWMELMRRERDSYQLKGWHHTPLIGALAAAAACANLRHLNAEQATNALGIAASQASGIVSNHGTMAKSFQVGKAAHAGVLSARLGQAGMTAASDSLDAQRGFLKAISPQGKVDLGVDSMRLGSDWHILEHGLSIKHYPICYCAHRTIDATLAVRDSVKERLGDIERIDVSMSDVHATILANHFPDSSLTAKFSAEFAVAAALLAGNVGLLEVNDAFVARQDVRDLMRKVVVSTNQNYDHDLAWGSMHDQVHICLTDGTRLSSEKVRYAKGHARLNGSSDELQAKFVDCVATSGVELDGPTLFATLQSLERMGAFRDLQRWLFVPGRTTTTV